MNIGTVDGGSEYTRFMDGNQGGEMPYIPVHFVNIGAVDGRSVYTRPMDGNPRSKCPAFPSIL